MKRNDIARIVGGVLLVVAGMAWGQSAEEGHAGRMGREHHLAAATEPGDLGKDSAGAGGSVGEGLKVDASLVSADKISVTHGEVTVGGKALDYTATTGYLPLKDETGKVKANLFFVAYTKDRTEGKGLRTEGGEGAKREGEKGEAAAATLPAGGVAATQGMGEASRPITFVFNGGPGAAAVWLHMGTAGPYRVEAEGGTEAAVVPGVPGKVVENAFTWLGETDLVFIDPVGTGYSRAATPEGGKEFYGVSEDVAAVGEFIRFYTSKYERWESPKFLAGESYGTTRAAALAEYLEDNEGIALNGIMLISAVLDFETLNPAEGNDLPYALFLPTYTATAFYHHKLQADLQKDFTGTMSEVEGFVLNSYIPALAKGADLPAGDRGWVVEQLARYTGLSKEYVSKSNLRIGPGRFEKELLNDEVNPRIVGRMDTRVTAYTADAAGSGAEFDPALSGYLPLYTAAFNDYVRKTLKYENDLPYEVLSGRVGPWNFGGGGTSGYLYVGDNLRNAMQKNPHLKVMVASGYFDLATPFFTVDYTLSHLNLPEPLRGNLTHSYYPGGHMMYHEKSSLEKLHADIARFIEGAVKG